MKGGSLGSNSAHVASADLQLLMSALGPKQTAPHMSAFGGKADMTYCENPLLRSLWG